MNHLSLRALLSNHSAHAIVLALALLMPSRAPAHMFRPDRSDSAKRCAICHLEWVYPFAIERRDGELLPRPPDGQVATPRMCFSCHDGSIADSRKTLLHDSGHRSGIMPSAAVNIPAEFPLDEAGRLQCSTCHTPHAVASGDGNSVGFFLRSTNHNSSFCTLCHGIADGRQSGGNHPLGVSLASIPLPLKEAGSRFGTDQPHQIICETCHIPHSGSGERLLVLPIDRPAAGSLLCEACHSSTPGRAERSALNRFSHPLGPPARHREKIPAVWTNGERVFLGTNGELVCMTCHKPHNAGPSGYLLVAQGAQDSLCVQCHPDQSALIGSAHDLRKSAPQAANLWRHPAGERGPCAACHSAHRGSAPFMWSQPVSDELPYSSRFCSGCHAEGHCAASAVPRDFSHPMEVGVEGFDASSLRLPLYDGEGRESASGVITCSTCHNVHVPGPAATVSPAENGHNVFLRAPVGENAALHLCMHCHQEQASVQGSKHDLTLTHPTFTNIRKQTPVTGGVCSPCHIAHGALTPAHLWAGILGSPPLLLQQAGKPVNRMTLMCTGCHTNQGTAPHTAAVFREHPAGLVVPDTLQHPHENPYPLYNADGIRTPEGDITCATCHNPHRWDARRNADIGGIITPGDASTAFLREGIPAVLCASCHGTEALFRFLFYHRPHLRSHQTFTPLQRKK